MSERNKFRSTEEMMMASRRRFLQWAGVGAAAASVAGGGGLVDALIAAEEHAVGKPAKPAFDLALASYSLRVFPLDKALAMTARLGLKHICLKDVHLPLNSTPEEIAAAVAKVKAAGIDLYACGGVSMHKPADVERAFKYAKAAGMRIIVALPSHDVLPLIDEKVKEYDICLAIHNHGPGDKYFPLPETAYEKIKGLDRRVGLCIDIGHTVRAGGDPIRDAERFADRLLDVHIKDVSSATAKGHTIEIGRGVIDIPRFLRTVKKIGYGGYLSFEFEKDEKDPLPGLGQSVGYVRGALAAI
jgi:sugar phosphate isomerase/epimerase